MVMPNVMMGTMPVLMMIMMTTMLVIRYCYSATIATTTANYC